VLFTSTIILFSKLLAFENVKNKAIFLLEQTTVSALDESRFCPVLPICLLYSIFVYFSALKIESRFYKIFNK